MIRRLETDQDALINSGGFLRPSTLLVYTKLWTKRFKLLIKHALEPALSQLTPLLIVILSATQSIPNRLHKKNSSSPGMTLSTEVVLLFNLMAKRSNLLLTRNMV